MNLTSSMDYGIHRYAYESRIKRLIDTNKAGKELPNRTRPKSMVNGCVFLNRMLQAKQFNEQKIIFDMAYDQNMTDKEARYTANQIMYSYKSNRDSRFPFDMHIYQKDRESRAMKQLHTLIPTLSKPSFPVEIHEQCFSEAFPKEQLVYLTPDSKNFLSEYDPRDVYVVPGVIDRRYDGPITAARAKQLGIRTAWFPLSRFLPWGRTHNGLPFNIMLDILMDFKNTRDWPTALKHIPQRKLRQIRRERSQLKPVIERSDQNDQENWDQSR